MTLTYVPTTELEAVNSMLEAIGEMPVSSLTDSGNTDAAIAYRRLHAVNRKVQTRGLHCNTEEHYPLTRGQDGRITVPANALRVDCTGNDKDVVVRGGYLYDRYNHTYVFTADIEVDITFFLPFTDLPEAVRSYVFIKASREFQQKVLGSPDLDSFNEQEEVMAWAELFRTEMMNADASVLDHPTAADIVNRRI